jgi:hypothetical protein
MIDTLELWLPKPPDNANARHHWRKALTLKQHYWRELDARKALGYHFPPAPAHPIPRARLEARYYHSAKRLLDADNAIRRLKPACDWLVRNGYLAGDDPARLVWTIPEQIVDRSKEAPPLCTVRLRLIALASEVAA